jgi:phage baseplate assembly protein W
MYDIFHEWGADLAVGSGGDIALASGSDVISQRVCRRLLTNPGDYLWNLDYGAGLARFIGQPARSAEIEAVITSQLSLETAIPTNPAPQVTTTAVDVANGYVVANIIYVDPTSQNAVTLNVSAG